MTECANQLAEAEEQLAKALDTLAEVEQKYADEAMEAADLRSELREACVRIDVLEGALDDIQVIARQPL